MSMRAISRGDKDQNGAERLGTNRNSERRHTPASVPTERKFVGEEARDFRSERARHRDRLRREIQKVLNSPSVGYS